MIKLNLIHSYKKLKKPDSNLFSTSITWLYINNLILTKLGILL